MAMGGPRLMAKQVKMIQAVPANPLPNQTLSPSCIRRLPDGAVSVSALGGDWVLQASQPLQAKFEQLLERRKQGTLDAEESEGMVEKMRRELGAGLDRDFVAD